MFLFGELGVVASNFTTKLAMISRAIAFQANGEAIFLDLLLRSVCWGHVSDGVRRRSYNKILFLRVFSRGPISCSSQKILRTSRRNGCSYEKGSLGKDIPSIGTLVGLLLALTWQAASALLGLASLPSTSWCGLYWWPNWSPYLPWCSRARTRGLFLESLGLWAQLRRIALWGPWKDFFAIDDWRAAMCWLVLGGLWKACLRLHKIGQSPTRRFSKNTSSACWRSCEPWKSLSAFL